MAHPQHAIPLILADGEVRPVVRAPVIERMSWALYDFSNTIFSMNVATLYFTVWLVERPWCFEHDASRRKLGGLGARRGRRSRFSARSRTCDDDASRG